MGFSKSLIWFMVVFFALIVSFMVEETKAQEADCAANLAPCANFLNSTKPPESCCKPLRETVTKQRDCLCNLYKNPGIFKSIGVNITQALELPKYCGVSADTSLCNTTSSPGPPSPTTSRTPPSSPTPPGGNPGSGASKMALTGVSTILLFWASVMAY